MSDRIKTGRKLDLNILLPLCIFIGAYVVPGTTSTSLGKMILFVVCVGCFAIYEKCRLIISNAEQKVLLFYMCYIVFEQLLVAMLRPSADFGLLLLNIINNVISICIILIAPKYIDDDKFYRAFTFFAVVSIAGMLVQSFQTYILGQETTGIVIPFLKGLLPKATWQGMSLRPQSFFSEPQAYCSYIAPFVILSLYRKKYAMAVIASITLLLSTSTTGFFLVGAIWLYWIFFKVDNVFAKGFCMVLFAGAAAWVVGSELFEFGINKIQNTDLTDLERTSKGYEILKVMPFRDVLLGVGNGNLANYMRSSNMSFASKTVTENNYTTTGFGQFITYGLIGGITYLLLCLRMIIYSKKFSRLVAILILITSFTQTIAFNNWGIWWFTIFAILRREETRKDEGVITREGISH